MLGGNHVYFFIGHTSFVSTLVASVTLISTAFYLGLCYFSTTSFEPFSGFN